MLPTNNDLKTSKNFTVTQCGKRKQSFKRGSKSQRYHLSEPEQDKSNHLPLAVHYDEECQFFTERSVR